MEHILFIGNSHTYYNDLPDIFKRLCKWNSREVFTVMLAHGGKGVDFHRNEPEVPHNIVFGGYDRIVLQDAANTFDKEVLWRDGGEIVRLIKKSGADGILYMPWQNVNNRERQSYHTACHVEFAKETGLALAPAGEAFWKFYDENPDIPLIRDDGEHATKKGSYLAACVIYCAMYGEKPKTDKDKLHEKMAEYAYETYTEYKEKICL